MADDNIGHMERERHEGKDDPGRRHSGTNQVEMTEKRTNVSGERNVDHPMKATKKHRDELSSDDDHDQPLKRQRKSHKDDEDEKDSCDRHRRRKHSKEKHKKKRKRKSHHRKEKDRQRKGRSRSYSSNSDSEESSTESEDTDNSRRHGKHRKSKDRYKDDDGDLGRRKRKHRESRPVDIESSFDPPDLTSTFGKYGIIKASDYHKQQRSFEVWMAEVKGIPCFTGPKWELQKYFQDYIEDFNTATFPHIKYYHFEQWEMEEYNKQQQLLQQNQHGSSGILQDEARHRQEMQEKARRIKQQELELARASLNPEKVQEMKQQLLLKTEMSHAFKTGDKEKFAKLQRRLEPDPK